MSPESIVVTRLGDAAGSLELAAVLAVAAAQGRGAEPKAALLIELGGRGASRPTILASAEAREAERTLGGVSDCRAAARGRICHLRLTADTDGLHLAGAALAALPGRSFCALHTAPAHLRQVVDFGGFRPRGAVLRADLENDRSLAALTAADLIARGLRVRVVKRPPGWLAGHLALAGLPTGAGAERGALGLLTALLGQRRSSSKRSLGMIVEC